METREVPEEIIVEILRHLPRKSHVRFQAVSKKWRDDLIPRALRRRSSNTGFVLHNCNMESTVFVRRKTSLHELGPLTLDHTVDSEDLPLPFLAFARPSSSSYCLGSHNGTVFFHGWEEGRQTEGGCEMYHLYDPGTESRFTLPPLRDHVEGTFSLTWLFGLAPNNDDDHFKFILLRHRHIGPLPPPKFDSEAFDTYYEIPDENVQCTLAIFDSKTFQWKRKLHQKSPALYKDGTTSFLSNPAASHCATLYLNGRLYWRHVLRSTPYLAVFCMRSEVLRFLDLPTTPSGASHCYYTDQRGIWESKGRLHYGHLCFIEGTLCVWQLLNDDDDDEDDDHDRPPPSWTQILNVSLDREPPPRENPFGIINSYSRLFAFDEYLQTIFLVPFPEEYHFLCYDMERKTLYDVLLPPRRYGELLPITYTTSRTYK